MDIVTKNDILFIDNNFVIVNKKNGIAVIPGRGKNENDCLLYEIEGLLKKKVFVAHRIDKDTSGIVVFALNAESHRNLCKQFTEREVKKEYFALVDGIPREKNGIIEAPVYQYGSGRMGVNTKGKESKTYYEIVEEYNKTSLVRLIPYTGRRHQIRVHMYFIGHPILGDPLYGKERPVGGVNRLMLHSKSIEFFYPERKVFRIESPFTEDWNKIVEEIKK